MTVRLTVNGREYQGSVEARKTLVDFLREDLRLNVHGLREHRARRANRCDSCAAVLFAIPCALLITAGLAARARQTG